jgi:ribosome-binding factor A
MVSGQHKPHDRKLAQLCAQVERVMSLALGESDDARLRELAVVSVEPAPSAARLLVRCTVPAGASLEQLDDYHLALKGARAWLRQQVAEEIERKKTPELAFVVLPNLRVPNQE